MKPVKLLCYVFVSFFRSDSAQRAILNLLTNRNIALIYSITICEQETKDFVLSRSFQHKLQHRCFQLSCSPAFITRRLLY